MPLKGNLQWIYCRTIAERETLLHLLDTAARAMWSTQIVVSDDLSVFERRFVFVDYVGISHDGVIFQLNPRADAQIIDVQVKVWGRGGAEIISYANTTMLAQPSATVKRWRVAKNLNNGKYLIEIRLEGHLAYRNVLVLVDKLV